MLCLTCWLRVAFTAGEVSGKTRRETPLRMWALKLISDLSSLTFEWMEANSLTYEMLLFIIRLKFTLLTVFIIFFFVGIRFIDQLFKIHQSIQLHFYFIFIKVYFKMKATF